MGTSSSKPDLTGYAKTDDLKGYAKTADLKDFAKSADVNAAAPRSELSKYATVEQLQKATPSLQTAQISEIASKLALDNTFSNAITSQLSGNAALYGQVASNLSTNGNFVAQAVPTVAKSVDFLNAVAEKLTTDATYKNRITGPAGSLNPNQDITFASTSKVTANGTFTANGDFVAAKTIKVLGPNVIEFGSDVAGKDSSAGKIGYGTFDSEALAIVGAGTTGSNRLVRVWDNMTVNGTLSAGSIKTGGLQSTSQWSCAKPYEYKDKGVVFASASSWDLNCGGGDHPGRFNQGDKFFVMTLPAENPVQVAWCGTKLGTRRATDGNTWTGWN